MQTEMMIYGYADRLIHAVVSRDRRYERRQSQDHKSMLDQIAYLMAFIAVRCEIPEEKIGGRQSEIITFICRKFHRQIPGGHKEEALPIFEQNRQTCEYKFHPP